MADQASVLMEKAGEQINVTQKEVEFYRLTGWKEVARPNPEPAVPPSLFTEAERKEIAKIVAAELVESSLSEAEQKAIADVKAAEKKVAEAQAKADKEAAEAKAKADKEAAAEAKAAEKKAAAEKK